MMGLTREVSGVSLHGNGKWRAGPGQAAKDWRGRSGKRKEGKVKIEFKKGAWNG